MNTIYPYLDMKCSFSFEELLELHREITILDDYSLQVVLIDALWKYYAQETYSYLQQIKLTNQYDPTLSRLVLGLDDLIQRSVENRYQIYLPEEKLWRERGNLSAQYMELVEQIRVHNGSNPLRTFDFNSKADEIVVQLFRDAIVIADQVGRKIINAEYLGELFWMEGLLIATWDYIGLSKKKTWKLDRYLKEYIFEYAESGKLDEQTREQIKWDYSEDAFKFLDSWEFRFLHSIDSTWKVFSKLIRRLLGKGRSEKEKKLEKLRKLIEIDPNLPSPLQ